MSPRRTGTRLAAGDYRPAIYRRDNHSCLYCGCKVTVGAATSNPKAATLDHVVPWVCGGNNGHRNLVTCCARCNEQRGKKTLRQWYRYLRNHGVNTNTIQRRVRRALAKDLGRHLRAVRKEKAQ